MTDLFGFLMFVGFVFCYIPQIIKLYKRKSSEDVAIWQFIITNLAYIAALGYMFCVGFGWWWFLNYFFGLVLSSWVIILCLIYRK